MAKSAKPVSRQRRTFNPKRRIRGKVPDLGEISEHVRYAGSPMHKSWPEKFGLGRVMAPRPDKTLCDGTGVEDLTAAEKLLRTGMIKGLVSVKERGGFPQNVWAVVNESIPVEAQLENEVTGTYHGYPMLPTDPLYDEVLRRWKAND